MASFNRVVLVGNVTRDIEKKTLASGTAVADLGLAVNDRVKRGEEWVDEVTFVDVTLFGRTADVAADYLAKGSQVLIEGRLKMDTWEKDGQKRTKLKIIGEQLKLLGSKAESGGGERTTRTAPKQSTFAKKAQDDFYATPTDDGGDVPF